MFVSMEAEDFCMTSPGQRALLKFALYSCPNAVAVLNCKNEESGSYFVSSIPVW